jgi:hypothetical protein
MSQINKINVKKSKGPKVTPKGDSRRVPKEIIVKRKIKDKELHIHNKRDMKYHDDPERGFEPHMGFAEMSIGMDILNKLSGIHNINLTDRVLSQIETIIALFVALQYCETAASFSSTLFLYLRTHVNKSVVVQIHEYLFDVLSPMAPHSSQYIARPAWLEFARNVKDNWALCKDNRVFKQFSKLMGVVVVLNLCEASSVTFDIKGYKIFEPSLEIIHGGALDIIDAALSTVTFFIEAMYNCFVHRSFKPLLMGDTALMEMDDEYATIINWWELVKNGNLMRVANTSDAEFDRRLETLTSKIKVLMQSLKGFEKKITSDKFTRLLGIKNDFITRKISSGVRRAPFCVEFFGSSSQGKTTCAEQMIIALLASADLPTDRTYWAAFNASDKYMSNWSTDKLVLQFDDVANTKSQFVEVSPTQHIINICNNQPYYANMADLSSKGKIFVEPELVTATTNVKDLDARLYSNCPYSIQRRMHVVITVEAKEEFQLIVDGKPQGIDGNKVAAKYTTNGVYKQPTFDDIWLLTLERAVQPIALSVGADYKVIVHNGKPLQNISFMEATNFLIMEFASHRAAQYNIIRGMCSRDKDVERCNEGGCIYIKRMCPIHNVVPHFGDEICGVISNVPSTLGSIMDNQLKLVETGVVKTMLFCGAYAARRCDIYKFLPSWIVQNDIVQNWYILNNREELQKQYLWCTIKLWLYHLFAFIFLFILTDALFGLPQLSVPLISLSLTVFQMELGDKIANKKKQELLDRNSVVEIDNYSTLMFKGEVCMYILFALISLAVFYLSDGFFIFLLNFVSALIFMVGCFITFYAYFARRERLALYNQHTFKPAVERVRDDVTKYVTSSVMVLGGLYLLAKCYKAWKGIQPQGSLEPKTSQEIHNRDKEINVWSGVVKRPLPITPVSKTVTHQTLIDIVDRNLLYGTIEGDKGNMMVNGLFIDSNIVVIPNHYFVKDEMKATFRKSNPEDCGGKFNTLISIENSVLIPDTDYRMCYVYNGGSFRSLIKHFPLDLLPDHPFSMIYRMKDGQLIKAVGFAKTGQVHNGIKHFIGGDYNKLSIDTFHGMCGATAISDTHGCVIAGLHLGGIQGTPRGCYGALTQSMLVTAIQQLRDKGLIKTGSGELFVEKILDKQILTHKDIHHKSPIKFLPQDSQITFHGTCVGASSSFSSVEVTPISHIVMDVCGVPNKWGPPKMRPEYYGWQTCLSNMSHPGDNFPQQLLNKAIKDFEEPLLELIKSDMYADIEPLNDKENVMGRLGCKFIDAIKLSTSIGYPLGGCKRNHIVEHDEVIDFTPEIWEEIDRCLACYRRGERAFPIAKAVKKDEVVSKDKCRIFYGNPIALTFLIRRYYLPLIRFLQLNPLLSECAVGVNCHGPEWEQLHQHMLKYSDEQLRRLIGGDYSKYDQKLPSQLILSALSILNKLARARGYSEADMLIMESMAGDIVYAVIAFNGDLISLTSGAHISGNSLTVIINGICGSLNARLFWYSLDKNIPFREAVAFMTYGDDNLGSVSEEHIEFNILKFSEFLAKYGQIYTMPDKETELTEWLKPDDFEFLKRKSVYNSDLGLHLGALVENSIFKSLHCYLREKGSPNTKEMACALNIDGALREWFNHGKVIYEARRTQMRDVANQANISHMCSELDLTYEDRLQIWRNTYLEQNLG